MGLGIVISDRQQEFLNWICKVELYCVVSLHDAWACGICWCVWFLWSPHWEVTLAWAHDLVAALPCIHKLQWWPLSNSFNHHIMPLSQDFQRAKTLGYSPRLSGPQQSHRRAGWAMCSKIAYHPQLAGVTFRYWAWFSSDLLAPSQNTDAEGRMMLKGVGGAVGPGESFRIWKRLPWALMETTQRSFPAGRMGVWCHVLTPSEKMRPKRGPRSQRIQGDCRGGYDGYYFTTHLQKMLWSLHMDTIFFFSFLFPFNTRPLFPTWTSLLWLMCVDSDCTIMTHPRTPIPGPGGCMMTHGPNPWLTLVCPRIL